MKSIATMAVLVLFPLYGEKPIQLDLADWSKGANPTETRKILAEKYQGKTIMAAGEITKAGNEKAGPRRYTLQVSEPGSKRTKPVYLEFTADASFFPPGGGGSDPIVWTISGKVDLGSKQSGPISRHIKLEGVKLLTIMDGDNPANRREGKR